MDYHFTPHNNGAKRESRISLRPFIPIFILAAALPFLLMIALNPSTLRFTSQADEENELRVWTEPARILSSAQKNIELTVKASFDSTTTLIPSLQVTLNPGGLAIDEHILRYQKPFRGEVVLGKVVVRASESGTYIVSPALEDITIFPNVPDVSIVTGSSQIQIK